MAWNKQRRYKEGWLYMEMIQNRNESVAPLPR